MGLWVLWMKSCDVVKYVLSSYNSLEPTMAQNQTLSNAKFTEDLEVILAW